MEDLKIQPIITLNDAITDSPVFRSSIYHQDIQLEQLEQWLNSLSRQLKLYTEKLDKFNMETTTLCQKAIPKDIDGTLIDPNFTGAVMKSFADALQTSLSFKTKLISDLEEYLITPLQQFVKTHLRDFKNFRKQFAKVMEKYEVQLAKYSSLSKTKEPSSIREEAFRLHEARKEYVRMSGQHVLRILNFRSLLEHCLVERFSSVTLAHKDFYNDIQVWANLDAALSFWKQWLADDKVTCAYQLQKQQIARKKLEDEYIRLIAPDHELVKYTVPASPTKSNSNLINSKWGYLFVRVSRHTWTRKWFFIYGGYFGVCQVDTTGKQKYSIICEARFRLMDCQVQLITDTDRRFCFEVSQPQEQTSFTLQAETENDLQDWIRVFKANKEDAQLTTTDTNSINDQRSTTEGFISLIDDSSLALQRNFSDEGPSYVVVSTTPELGITLSSSSSLTPLLVWESIRNSSGTASILPAGSWGIPWSFIPTMINMTQDSSIIPAITKGPVTAGFPRVVWPAKPAIAEIPNVDIQGYTDDTSNKELRALFGGVRPDEIVLDTFVCCLRKPGVDSPDKDIETSQSTLNSACADVYEKEFVHQLKQIESTPPSNFGYAYTGTCYITQDTFWFYSNVMTTCINSVVVRLKDIEEIKVIKDESLKRLANDTALAMKSDMVIYISLVPNARKEDKQPIILGTLMEDIDLVAEKLQYAVKNAKLAQPEPVQTVYNDLKQLSMRSLSHKSVVLDLPLNFNTAVTTISKNTQNLNTGTIVQQGRPHAATVGAEAKVNSAIISRARGESEPIIPASTQPLTIKKPPKPDPDMPPFKAPEGPVECNCTDHLDRQDLQINLPISAKRCYELLFSNEQTAPPTNGGVWFDKTLAIEGHDLSVTKWSMVDGKMQRVLKYWMPVANPIVRMKEAEVVETQVLISKEEYVRYTVQISTKTAALPYAEAFIPSVRYCITWVSKSECQLTCYLGVRWVKNPLVKSIVTRSALKGMSDSVGVFGPILKNAAENIKAQVDESRRQVVEYNSQLLMTSENVGDEKEVEQVVAVPSPSVSSTVTSAQVVDTLPVVVPKERKVTNVAPVQVNTSVAHQKPVVKEKYEPHKHEHLVHLHRPRELQEPKEAHSWWNTAKTFIVTNVLNLLLVASIGLVLYLSISWFTSDVALDAVDTTNTTVTKMVDHSQQVPFRRTSSRSVYLKDLDEGFLRNSIHPPFAKSTSYQVFLKLKKLEHSESIQDNSVYDHQWFTVDHYHLAVDLNVSRERIAMLRHDLLTVFQVLNTLELQMVENEYMNWLLDTQLKCNYRPPTKEDPLAEDASTLCQDVNVQLDKFF